LVYFFLFFTYLICIYILSLQIAFPASVSLYISMPTSISALVVFQSLYAYFYVLSDRWTLSHPSTFLFLPSRNLTEKLLPQFFFRKKKERKKSLSHAAILWISIWCCLITRYLVFHVHFDPACGSNNAIYYILFLV
jgi:hypothetical protein